MPPRGGRWAGGSCDRSLLWVVGFKVEVGGRVGRLPGGPSELGAVASRAGADPVELFAAVGLEQPHLLAGQRREMAQRELGVGPARGVAVGDQHEVADAAAPVLSALRP